MFVIAFDVALEGRSIRASRSIGEDSHEFIRPGASRDARQPLLNQRAESRRRHSRLLQTLLRQTERSSGHDKVT
jgi:hypothetical protein